MTECQRCGKCCTGSFVILQAMVEDIERWQEEGRQDILKYVWDFDLKSFDGTCSCDIWVSPITGHDLLRCPFLRKVRNKEIYKCLIHETKPEICQVYPDETHDYICARLKEEMNKGAEIKNGSMESKSE